MINAVLLLRERAGVSQSTLARCAGTSQPTIAAYEAGTKSPTVRTLERLAASVGLELQATFVPPLTREERRSLELHRAIARRLLADPDGVLARARRNLATMAAGSPGAATLWSEWRHVLGQAPSDIADLLVDAGQRPRELRHVTPFAGVLTPTERREVYHRFRTQEHRGAA
jgi:transcriptional regulator with XRE-family HTH domain